MIPPEQYALIPLEALGNIMIELLLNRYAFYTTGYADDSTTT